MYNKINYISAVLVALLLCFTSCSEKFQEAGGGEEPQVQKGKDILSLSLEGFSATKLQLQPNGNDYHQVWTEGDKICVIGTSGKTDLTLYEGSGTASGTFSGDLSGVGDKPYYIVFPCEEGVEMESNVVHFSIPKVKTGACDNVAPGSMPCVAWVGSDGSTAGMKNVMGLLRLTLSSSPSVNVSKMTLHDLGGNMLLGDCSVPVKDDESLDYSNIELKNGDNSISLVWEKNSPVEISSDNKSFFFPVPPGSLDRGFSVVIYDETGKAYTFIQKISNPVEAERASFVYIAPSALTEKSEPKESYARGYYKSIFVDAGIGLSKFYTYATGNDIPAIEQLGLTDDCEFFVSRYNDGSKTDDDEKYQHEIFVGSNSDANGVLLYPDNSPRFRMMYSNGGSSQVHGTSLGQDGRDRIHTFNANGGSFVGSCAGSFLAATDIDNHNYYDGTETDNYSYGLFPGKLYHTFNFYINGDKSQDNLKSKNTYYIDFSVLKSFGTLNKDGIIKKVRHYGGSFLPNNQDPDVEEKTERLLSFYDNEFNSYQFVTTFYSGENLCGATSTWAYKGSNESGRVVCTGSHPEHMPKEGPGRGADEDEYKNLTASMFTYAMEGTGIPRVKAPDLVFGSVREMNKTTGDNTGIGDRQYHHFKFNLPHAVKNFTLTLSSDYGSDSGIDLYLSLRNGGLAWLSDADYTICTKGGNKILNIKELPAGDWYVGVYCATKVKATRTGRDNDSNTRPYYFIYTNPDGKSRATDAINGIPYTIKINLESSDIIYNYQSESLGDENWDD